MPVKFRRLQHPITLRPSSRDVETLISNAVRCEYGQLALATNVPYFIVDAGAYIGDTSAFFLSQYRRSTVVALEPNPESFAIAESNLKPYGERVILLNMALADRPGTLFLSGSETGARVGDTGSITVKCATVKDLIAMSPSGRINILKLDIEGAEQALFRDHASAWMDNVDHILVETHGPECDAAVLDAIHSVGWKAGRHRNLYYCSASKNENQLC